MNRRLLGYLLLITIGILFLLQLYFSRAPFGRSNTSFGIGGGADITGVDLIKGDIKLSLRKEGETWIVNKSSEARKNAVKFIIRTLREMKIKSPVGADKFIEEVTAGKIEPVRVNVFERRRLIRSFYVYRTMSNIYGNIMKVKPSSKPYIVYVPGFEGDIGSDFEVNELYWQPFTVFKLLPSQIRSVEMQDFSEPTSSFTIRNDNGILSLADRSGTIQQGDSMKLKRYLSYFVAVSFESRAFSMAEEESKEILSSPPVYRIIVEKSDGEVIKLSIRAIWNEINGVKTKDTDRAWGYMEDGKGLFIMRYFDLDPIIKKRSYFFTG